MRTCTKTCVSCGQEFTTAGPRTLKCEACRVCLQCGKPVYESATRFCGHRCAALYRLENGDGLANNLAAGRASYTEERRVNIAKSKLGKARPNMRGPNNPMWKGNKTERRTAMERAEYQEWRRMVFERDDYTCQDCRRRGGRLRAHHIKPWAFHPDLRYEVSNGLTLCEECHKKTHKKPHSTRR